jgi:hypothetical protein
MEEIKTLKTFVMSQIDDTEKKKNEPTDGYYKDHLHKEGFEQGRAKRLASDERKAQSALKKMERNPKSATIIAKGNIHPSQKDSYRNAPQHTREQNKNFGTNYKPENVDKIKSESVGNISVHAVRDNPSGKLFQGKHLKMKDEKVSTSNHNFQQNKKDIAPKSALSKKSNQTASQTNNAQAPAKNNSSQSALSYKKTTPTNSQAGGSGKGSSALKSLSENSSVAKPSTESSGGAAKTTSPSTSSTNSSSKGKSR